jgi:ABC-type phosphate transport system substrate-binding protein
MNPTNAKIATSIAFALGGGISEAYAQTPPTPTQCSAAYNYLYVAGSSAAQPAFAAALANDLFDANGETTISATGQYTNIFPGNFKVYCGFAKAGNGAGAPTGSVVTFYYRAEGGSIMGALPIASGRSIMQLDLSTAACQVSSPVVNGTSATVGTIDGWTGCVTKHAVEMGITDIDPPQFTTTSGNYPTAYSATVFGSANLETFVFTGQSPVFDQVFGLYVNTQTINGASAPGAILNLSREAGAAIFSGSYTDWSEVANAAGGAVSSVPAPITVVSREAGSGTRTGVSMYFLGQNCSTQPLAYVDNFPSLEGYTTDEVLTYASTIPGAITYASIDNTKAGLTLVQLSRVTPSNLAAATGQYDWWYTAYTQREAAIASPGGLALFNWLKAGELQNLLTAPERPDIVAIPNIGTNGPGSSNVQIVPLLYTITATPVYLTPYSRGTSNCNIPTPTNDSPI